MRKAGGGRRRRADLDRPVNIVLCIVHSKMYHYQQQYVGGVAHGLFKTLVWWWIDKKLKCIFGNGGAALIVSNE